jgi:hypothetical protein
MVASDARLPFGGVKRAGYGRELSEYGIKESTNIQTVYVGPAKPATATPAPSPRPSNHNGRLLGQLRSSQSCKPIRRHSLDAANHVRKGTTVVVTLLVLTTWSAGTDITIVAPDAT